MRKSPWRATVLAAAAGLVLTTFAPAAQGDVAAGRVLSNTRLDTGNDPLRGRDIPGLAVDPADSKHVVMIDEDFLSGQCDYHVSYDAGKTWTGGHLKVPSDFAQPPCNTFDSGGYAHYNKSVVFGTGQNVYTTFASHRGAQQRPESNVVAGEGDSVIVNHSADGGKTWDVGVVAIPGATDSRPFIIRPGVAVQPRAQGDKVYVVGWYVVNPPGMGASGGAGDRRAVVASSEDGGKTWAKPVEAQGPDEKVREIAPPVVGPDGAVYIAWRNRDDPATAPHPIEVAKSTDGGLTWTRTPLGDVTPAPTNVAAPAGSSGYPRMAVDPRNGNLYVVYDGFNFGDLDVVFQKSTDKGATWSAPVRVNDDPKNGQVRQLTPQVFVAPNGRIDVIWMDTRTTYPSAVVPKPAGFGDLYYASSTDGATFTSSRRISDRSMNLDEGLLGRIGTYTWYGPAAAPLGNDQVLFAWGDPRFSDIDNATNDIMLATLQLGDAGPPAVTHLPKASTENLSVAASQVAYPAGPERIGANFFSRAVVVSKDDKAGAMAGAVLARSLNSPLLVVSGSTLSKEMKKEVGRLHPTGMYVIGSTTAVSDTLVNALKSAGVNTNVTTPPTTATPATTAAPATTTAPTTTAPTATASSLAPATTAAPATTTTTIATPTANRGDVVRLTGATPADVAKAIAGALDLRTDAQKSSALPAFGAAVVVNPDSDDAAAGVAFAAYNRYPILYVSKDGVPAATADTFNSMAIQTTYVVGGPNSVSDAVMGKLPKPTRLGGADLAATTDAVNNEIKTRAAPVNVVYVADSAKPVDAAVAATAVSRVGGLLIVTPGASTADAQKRLDTAGLGPAIDEIMAVKSAGGSTSVPWVVFVVIALFAIAGLVLLARASKVKGKAAPAPAKQATAKTTGADVKPKS